MPDVAERMGATVYAVVPRGCVGPLLHALEFRGADVFVTERSCNNLECLTETVELRSLRFPAAWEGRLIELRVERQYRHFPRVRVFPPTF